MSHVEAMTPNDSSFDPRALLTEIAWVRRLARSLLPSDVHVADDVAQDACLAALEHRPDSRHPLAGWLAEVTRNLVRQKKRGESRRGTREERASRDEALPSTLDVVEQLAVHRELVDAVMQLDEPYRTTIVRRYFEELSPTAIAKREGVPVATVKTRLARGLDRLRVRLDREHGGDGRSWLLALIPICKPSSGAVAATTLGAFVVSTSIKVGLAVAVVAGGLFLFWPKHPSNTDAAPALAAESASEVKPETKRAAQSVELAGDAKHDERTSVANAAAKIDAHASTVASALAPWRGLVLDLEARPVGGVRVCFQNGSAFVDGRELAVPRPAPSPDAASAASDASGRFEIPAQETAGGFIVCDEHLTTVLAAVCSAGAGQSERVIVVAPKLEWAGRVIDENGKPLAGVRVESRLPRDFRTSFAHNLDHSTERGWFAETAADGRFTVLDVPRVAGMDLFATSEGFVQAQMPAPEFSNKSIEIVLRRPSAAPGTVSGEVVDAHGRGVGGARVSLDQRTTLADERGRFAIEIPKGGAKQPIMAIKIGYQPATETLSSAVQSGTEGASEYVVLHLGPPPLSIEGQVVDADGRGLAGMKVWAGDVTFFGDVDEIPANVEGVLAGAATRADIERIMREAKEPMDPMKILQERPTICWSFVQTDGSGRFKIEGLLDREYTLVAMDPETLLRVDSAPIRAGTKNAKIELPARLYLDHLSGRVVSRAGKPIAGVNVTPTTDVMTIHPTPNSTTSFHSAAKPVVTDADGRFAFHRLPRERVYLQVVGENILPVQYGRPKRGDGAGDGLANASKQELDDILITAPLRYHMQIELAPERADLADRFRVVDESGNALTINVFEGSSHMSTDEGEIHDGKSRVVAVTEETKTLVLLKGLKEIQRVPLALAASGVNVVRP